MTDQRMRDELNDVKQHAKEAMRSSLLAVRTAVDFALSKLEGDNGPGSGSGAAGASGDAGDATRGEMREDGPSSDETPRDAHDAV